MAYLNDRLARGETLNADSPVISPDNIYSTHRERNSKKRFLPTGTILKLIRESLRPRFAWRPYVFRAYFDTQLLIADSLGEIAARAIKGDREYVLTYYRKSREERAEDYRKVIPKLSVFGTDEKSKLREQVEAKMKTLDGNQLTRLQEFLKTANV